MNVIIRVNGRGNAWPIELGAADSRNKQLGKQPAEYANTSLSILALAPPNSATPRWDILFDVGQGIVPFLIQQANRLPDAIILSHSHFDHIAGLDWLVACQRRHGNGQRLPVYATMPCWQDVIARFGWLQPTLELRELIPGETCGIPEAPGLSITPFPVFHGDWAPGACMVMVEVKQKKRRAKAIFTGDLLCPLLRKEDIKTLQSADVVYTDANTRFPCPMSGHWSIVPHGPKGARDPAVPMKKWTPRASPSYLVTPHSRSFDVMTHRYLDQFLREAYNGSHLLWSVKEFVDLIKPQAVQLMHYSGHEDKDNYKQAILPDSGLLTWVTKLDGTIKWFIPHPGDTWKLL